MARDRDRERERRRTPKDTGRRVKKKICIFCKEHIQWVDYKDVNLLRRFMSDRGEILEVSDGFPRNYLVPKGLAMRATDGAMAQAAAMRRARDLKEAKDRAGAEEVARRLTPVVIRIPARAGAEGRLFGSVTTADI